jgi:hypothetical protein
MPPRRRPTAQQQRRQSGLRLRRRQPARRAPLALLLPPLALLLLAAGPTPAAANTIVQLRYADEACGAGAGAASHAAAAAPYPLTVETVPAGSVCSPGVRPYDGACTPLPEAGTSIRATCIAGDLPDSWVAIPPGTPLPATLAVSLSFAQPRCNGPVSGAVAYFTGICAPVPPAASSQMICTTAGRAKMLAFTTAACDASARVRGEQDFTRCSTTGNTRAVCVTVQRMGCASGWVGVDALTGQQKCL